LADNTKLGLSGKSWMDYDATQGVMDRLGSDQKFHDNLRSYLLDRITTSERAMSKFYPRWNVNEKKVQAYIDLPDYEQLLKEMNEQGKPPSPVSITFPYAFATLWTVVTYMVHTFTGRRPMFQVAASKAESVQSAKNMETVLQWNADATRMVSALMQYFVDGELYGVSIVRCLWKQKFSKRSRWKTLEGVDKWLAGALGKPLQERVRDTALVFEGNEVVNVDPFMFFPDPSVPMNKVNKEGEYVFWRTFSGKHTLLEAQAAKQLRYVEKAADKMPTNQTTGDSARGRGFGGDSSPGMRLNSTGVANAYQVDQGSVVIIPAELGLGESTAPEKWLFTILNKDQIVQAEPLDLEHDMHPVAVTEPNTMGYGFGQMSLVDYIGPIQDTLSWLLNSHMHNVRSTINNSFIVNPAMVELGDLRTPNPDGKIIRLKPAALGMDVRQAVQQLAVTDVTANHMNDLGTFMRTGDAASGVSDNMRGIQDGGGRKTATEVRTSSEAGASRLASKAICYSSQGIVDLTEQMSVNLQANMSTPVFLSIVGAEGRDAPIEIKPDSVVGDFYYPVHDGTLPIDRVALVDVWKELMIGVAQDPELRKKFSLEKIFEFTAKLGGATNIESFKVQIAPEGAPVGAPIPTEVPNAGIG